MLTPGRGSLVASLGVGLKGRIKTGLRHVWSPITVWMADEGSDDLVTAGERAKAVVKVKGEDDGSVDRIELSLVLSGFGADQDSWQLGPVPTSLGLHEVEVELPADLAPSCAGFVEYRFNAELFRTKGIGSDAGSVVDVIGRPEHVYWPEGPRAGREGEDLAEIDVTLELETADIGGSVRGTVAVTAVREVKRKDLVVELAAAVRSPASDGEPKPVTTAVLAERASLAAGERRELQFSLDVPPVVTPTLDGPGKTWIAWQVRATLGDATGWRWVAVLDPEARAGVRNRASPGLLEWLVSLDTNPQN